MNLKQFEFSRGFDLMKIKTKLQTAASHQSAAGEIEKSVTLITEIKILRSGG